MNENQLSTQELLLRQVDVLEEKLLSLEEEKTAVLIEPSRTKKALDVVRDKNRQRGYEKTALLKDKILYCFTIEQRILPIASIIDILKSKEPELRDQHNLDDSIRRQMAKLISEGTIVQYQTSKMKNLYYALKSWTDDIGEVYSRLLLRFRLLNGFGNSLTFSKKKTNFTYA